MGRITGLGSSRRWLRLGLVTAALIAGTIRLPARSVDLDSSGLADKVVALTNEARVRAGLPPLAVDDKLAEAAGRYAQLMRDADEIGHTVGGQTIPTRLAAVGYAWQAMGENVAYISEPDAGMVVKQWMHSAPHRTNILRRSFRDIGVGVAGPSRSGRYYFSQLFGAHRR